MKIPGLPKLLQHFIGHKCEKRNDKAHVINVNAEKNHFQ